MSSQAFALTPYEKSHGCNHEVGDCPDQGGGGGSSGIGSGSGGWGAISGGGGGGGWSGATSGVDANITINAEYSNLDNSYWVANDGKSAGYADWTTFGHKASQEIGGKVSKGEEVLFKIIPGTIPARPDFSKYEMVPGSPAAFKAALQKAKDLKAAKIAFEAGLQKKKAVEQAASQNFSAGDIAEHKSPLSVAGAGKVAGPTAMPTAQPVGVMYSGPINARNKP